jgi:hypothetical protein
MGENIRTFDTKYSNWLTNNNPDIVFAQKLPIVLPKNVVKIRQLFRWKVPQIAKIWQVTFTQIWLIFILQAIFVADLGDCFLAILDQGTCMAWYWDIRQGFWTKFSTGSFTSHSQNPSHRLLRSRIFISCFLMPNRKANKYLLLFYDKKTRVARFFSVQNYQNGKKLPNEHKLYQTAIKYTKLAVKYSKGSLNIPTFSFPKPS